MIGLHLIIILKLANQFAWLPCTINCLSGVQMFTTITIINRCLEQLFRNAPAPPPSHGHPLQQGGKFMDTSSFSTGMTMVDWGCCTMVSFPWSRCQMCYSVVNNYLSAGRNRFDLESGPWTIRATRGKETLYPVVPTEDWSLLGSV